MNAHQVTITKLDHSGRPVLSYPGEVVYRDEELLVARCLWESKHFDLGGFCLEPDDIFMEFYYLRECFNIFQVYSAFGRLKGWYCNVTEPAELTEGEVHWRDLVLDLLVLPDGRQVIRDGEEFEALHPSAELRLRATTALERLQRWAEERRFPFRYSRPTIFGPIRDSGGKGDVEQIYTENHRGGAKRRGDSPCPSLCSFPSASSI